MYLVKSLEDYKGRRIEVLAELEKDVIKVLERFAKDGLILEEVVTIPNYQTSKEYLNEKPEDLVYGKKEAKDDTK